MSLVYYPLDKKTNARRRCVLDFTMNSPEHAQSWTQSINRLLLGENVSARRHVLILVNPFGGTKRAPELWKSVVKPVFDVGGLTYDVVFTEYQGHARQLAMQLDLTKYDCVGTISGDGLFWELLNGLLSRPDWHEAVKMPLAIMPGGSGNALAHAAGMGDCETAAFCVARGRARPFDAATVLQEKHRCTAFINFSWGIVSDVDFESERFRWMGEPRFTVVALQRIASLRIYRGRLSYYPDPDFDRTSAPKCIASNCPKCLPASFPGRPVASGLLSESPDSVQVPDRNVGAFFGMERVVLPPGPPMPLVDALESGNEDGWTHMESESFVMLTASNSTHISSDMRTGPYAHWSDGCWDLVVVNDVPKMALMKLFLSIENGEHVESPDVTYLKVRAFRLDPAPLPQDLESFLDVDGERMPVYGKTLFEVHRGMLKLVTFE